MNHCLGNIWYSCFWHQKNVPYIYMMKEPGVEMHILCMYKVAQLLFKSCVKGNIWLENRVLLRSQSIWKFIDSYCTYVTTALYPCLSGPLFIGMIGRLPRKWGYVRGLLCILYKTPESILSIKDKLRVVSMLETSSLAAIASKLCVQIWKCSNVKHYYCTDAM